MPTANRLLWLGCLGMLVAVTSVAAEEAAARPKRVLLLAQKPDSHPFGTHEYLPAAALFARLLQPVEGVQTVVVQADSPWAEGPELLDGADGVVLFLTEGAKWVGDDPRRLEAFQRLAKRGGGLVCLHWGMGCRDAEYVEDFVHLFGGCHGGPDRKYQIVTVTAEPVDEAHPVLRGIEPFRVREEFYYRLKRPKSEVTPLIQVPIDGETHTVGWAWQRPDGGRSFGFSGGHYHENWALPEYRRLVAQGVLWTLDLPIPEDGFNVDLPQKALQLKPREEK
jgi:type 1 glutamine amidotransferase